MLLLDGKKVLHQRKAQLAERVKTFVEKRGAPPCLSVVLVGDDPASQIYVGHKIKACKEVGLESRQIRLEASSSTDQIVKTVQKLNNDPSVHGILVQLPLPKGVDSKAVIDSIRPEKDADGLHVVNQGRLFRGDKGVLPCTPSGIINLLKFYNIPIQGRDALVIGRSEIVGKPMVHLLLKENATVTVAHSRTADLAKKVKRAEIVVVAAGQPEFLGVEDFSPQAVIVDVGIHRKSDGKLCGDVRRGGFEAFQGALSPVPGGVGPMTIGTLLENTFQLACEAASPPL